MNTLQELEQFIPIERIQYLDRQEMLFEEHKGTLLKDYEGQFRSMELEVGRLMAMAVMPILSWGNNPLGQSVFMVVNGV
jgi:hypothetical protein